ncbi:CmcJ/NvfI family oxidoreductase [Novosphingobium bradum]|uniref:CmcJ/NvfI family oxidoreductase n=1 Tax=Novosphingobium bradum TaxID=1737444 RepID=A0ABV7INU5_9SPHN
MSVTAKAKASVNFMPSKADGGKFSSWDSSRIEQKLVAVEIDALNMRELDRLPSVDVEGFTLAKHPIDGDWTDRAWLDEVYVPTCLDLVKKLTGATTVLNIYYPIIRSSGGPEADGKVAPPAPFIHYDQTREAYAEQAAKTAAEAGHKLGRKAAVFNVWKAISPAPQPVPLALCDQRDVPEEDFVLGVTLEGGTETPYVSLLPPSKPYPLYYVPDLKIDESLVFMTANFDPAKPLGVAHTAIANPRGTEGLPARRSVELRILALFD